jgi:hypothetical protein
MFDSYTRRERMGAGKVAAVAAVAAAILGAQGALLAWGILLPVTRAIPGIQGLAVHQPARDDLPTFGEAISVTAPYRLKRAVSQARGAPWRSPDPVAIAALNGYCLVDR